MKKQNSKKTASDVEEFLRESNHIEWEYTEEAYQDALKAWEYLIKQPLMTLDVIKKTHKILMKSRKTIYDADKGEFRTYPVWVGNHEGMDHRLIGGALLMDFCLNTIRAMPKLTEEEVRQLHVTYERIHPFGDGNGRTGRMFMNWTRIKRCGLPILVIKESEKHAYYDWFR